MRAHLASSISLAALQAGQIAATTMAAPLNYAAQELGLDVLGKHSDGIPHFQINWFTVRRLWAEENRGTMVRFMKVHVQLRWLFDNKEAGSAGNSKRRIATGCRTAM